MTIQTNSRFITYPSIVEKSNNHTVILIDANESDIEDIGYYCKVSDTNYDIYLYRGDTDDLQWLSHVSQLADYVLISESSNITSPSSNLAKFGNQQTIPAPLDYFLQHDAN